MLIRRRGVGPEPVALLLPQGLLSVVGILGVLKAGKAYVSLEPAQSGESLQRILSESEAQVLLTDARRVELAREIGSEEPVLIDLETVEPASSPSPMPSPPSADSLAYVFFTSGTTGRPKGVFDTHRNVLHNVMRYTNSLQIGCDDRLTLFQSPSFSGSVSSLFAALLNGACVFAVDLPNEPLSKLADWIRREKITIYHSVPAVFRSVFADGLFPGVRVVRLEGDQASLRDVALFHDRFAPGCILVNGLGITETGLVCQYFIDRSSTLDGSVIPVGYAVEDTEIELLDAKEGVGEIAVRSCYLAAGYWKRPELTSRSFRNDSDRSGQRIYRTGDLGRFRANGCLEYLGRVDSRIKIRGHWVELADVAGALLHLLGQADQVDLEPTATGASDDADALATQVQRLENRASRVHLLHRVGGKRDA